MIDWLSGSTFFAVFLTVAAFELGRRLQARFWNPLLNPILIGAVSVILVLTLLGIPNEVYQAGVRPLSFLLTPATVCFAVPFYVRLGELKGHLGAILAGVLAGTLISLGSIASLVRLWGLDDVILRSLLPKSVTTAIGVALSEEAGGIPALTTAAIIVTGIGGNICGPALCRLFRIKSEIAQGVAFGTSSHAIGTTRAMELSDLAGAVSSFSLTLAGLITAVVLSLLLPG